MNLKEEKIDVWGGPQTFNGRYKSHKVSIRQHNDGWYVSINDLKTDKSLNSLWKNVTFATVELARDWAIEIIKEGF